MDPRQRNNTPRNNLRKSNEHLFKEHKIIPETPKKVYEDNFKLPNIKFNDTLNKKFGTNNKMDFSHIKLINRPEEEFFKSLKIKPKNIFSNNPNELNNKENNKNFNAKNINKSIYQRIQSESNLFTERNQNKRYLSLDTSRKKEENNKNNISIEQSHKNFIKKKSKTKYKLKCNESETKQEFQSLIQKENIITNNISIEDNNSIRGNKNY